MMGQPDFGHLQIDCAPRKLLKLFLGAFRNHGAFHEDCSVYIGKRLTELLDPEWLRVEAYWYPRGGISSDVFWASRPEPKDFWIPE